MQPKYDTSLDWDEYKAYIQSKEWDKKRTERLIFDDFQCQLCGNRSNVQVHHLVYPLHGNFGAEPINDLITLCSGCHQAIDDFRKGQEVSRRSHPVKLNVNCWLRVQDKDELNSIDNLIDVSDNNYRQSLIPLKVYIKDKEITIHKGYVKAVDIAFLIAEFGHENVRIIKME